MTEAPTFDLNIERDVANDNIEVPDDNGVGVRGVEGDGIVDDGMVDNGAADGGADASSIGELLLPVVTAATAAVVDAEDMDEIKASLPSQAAPLDVSADNGGVSSNILSTAPNMSDSSCAIEVFSLRNLFARFSTVTTWPATTLETPSVCNRMGAAVVKGSDGPSLEISATPRPCRRTATDGKDIVIGGDDDEDVDCRVDVPSTSAELSTMWPMLGFRLAAASTGR